MVSIFEEDHKWLSRLWKRVFTAMLCGQTGESSPQKPHQDPPEDHRIVVNDDGAESTESKIDHHHQQQPQKHQDHPRDDSLWVDDGAEDELGPPESLWIISIKENLKKAGQEHNARPWEKLSSYQIPHYLKDGKDNTYVPQVVSLGPYYHDKKHLRQMDGLKWRCLHRMLRRTNNYKIVPYPDSVKDVEDRARTCYEGKINMSSDEFAEMMVLDGCFVIELFWGFSMGFKELGYDQNDPVFSFMGLAPIIRRDMIMLENQIPLFILERLFCILCGQPKETGLLAKLAFQFFYPLTPTKNMLYSISINRLEFDPLLQEGELPCLELFRRSLLYPGIEWKRKQEQKHEHKHKHKLQQRIPCVTELRKGGIKFRKGETDRLWDIQFKGGTLKIPQLLVHDGTRSLFLNLIAFEQCHINCTKVITSYIIFMVNLINSPEDVGHLHECGIIEDWLGSNIEVADLFNQLSKEVLFDINDSYLYKVAEEVNTYSSYKRHHWIASLKLEYFDNPWSIISLIAAFILLVLTFTQTFYGAYGYYRPRS
ncbi:UPF0481 protein At3g47200-like [Eucalyptus grandis]|uniref:UPF0481 protein At3g47200-like n=1 Tax=Eucalyptus grandis TaxID=71139 RepID=UPI00192ED014|nr:UPF0481 protein At3g47200-like [Eucalyptus grandis]